MVQEASVLLEHEDLDPLSRLILSGISVLDNIGLRTVDLNVVGAATFGVLLSIRLTFKKYKGVDWYALVHALVTGWGSLLTVYLDIYAAQLLTGVSEPLRSCQCHGPLTSLHRILPAITMGYAVFDILDGLTIGIDFILHGAATLFIMAIFVQMNAPHVVTPFLLMEVSTINLAMMRAEFFSETGTTLNIAMFAFLFMVFRIIVCPWLWFKLMVAMNSEKSTAVYQDCFSEWLFPISFFVGAFFHCLNSFWFYKIVRKIQRKLAGEEAIKQELELTDSQEKKNK